MLKSGSGSLRVVGLAGLGHVTIKFGKAFGLQVTVISTSPAKEREVRERLKADEFIVNSNQRDAGTS
jgi:cinnamyl-alcohol dehydrogenase